MNGIHDMGGLHGFGPVKVDPTEPVFVTRWGSRVFCMTQVIDRLGVWNLDEHRHEIELMSPQDYLTWGYYGRWMFAMERILNRRNILTSAEVSRRVDELSAGLKHLTPPDNPDRNWPLKPEDKLPWGAWRKDVQVTPVFEVGQAVRVRNIHPPGHTRVTSYTRGKIGVVHRVDAHAWVFPDTRAHHGAENLQAVYNVCFSARTLWGDEHAEANLFIYIDLSEDHLEAAGENQHES
jgi:nitrile hydratase beta subunit